MRVRVPLQKHPPRVNEIDLFPEQSDQFTSVSLQPVVFPRLINYSKRSQRKGTNLPFTVAFSIL